MATTCPTTPVDYDSEDCVVGTVTICSDVSADEFACDLSAADGASEIHVVTSWDSSTYKVQAWGYHDGDEFCCHSGANWNGKEVTVDGSAYGDTLVFGWDGSTYYLESAVTGWSTAITTGTINGGAGNDTIIGSVETAAAYIDWLNGEDGADSITGKQGDDEITGGNGIDTCNGNAGADTIYGDAGNDILDGGAGNDTIHGGDGTDTITGGDGQDTINGDDGRDYIGGGNGDDTIDGGLEGDVICGDAETGGDTLDDGDADAETVPDVIYGANSLDLVTCQDNSTQVDTWSNSSGCNGTTIGSKPALCP